MKRSAMCARLMSVGLTKRESSQILTKVELWVKESGEEWTITRLKETKAVYVHHLSGEHYSPPLWMRFHADGTPKGPLRVLFKSRSSRSLSKVLTGLGVYTAFVSSSVTSRQYNKFMDSVESSDETGLDAKFKLMYSPANDLFPSTPPTWVEYCVGQSRAPFGTRTVLETDWVSVLKNAAMSNVTRGIIARHESIFAKVIPIDLLFNYEPDPYPTRNPLKDCVGHLSPIQEPGFKLRAVANPDRVLQACLEPLKRVIMKRLKALPQDCTFDQRKAIPFIQKWMNDGKTVYSVDLSDATNTFPWPLQKNMLERTFPNFMEYIEIMDEVTRSPWLSKIGEHQLVEFSRGQPLGLGPSFGTFAMAHNLLLEGICRKQGYPRDYFILGDDIVVGNDDLYRRYMASLSNLGCKVSDSKSFSSKKYAEFAGFSITPKLIGKGFKWRDISDVSFMDAARMLGKGSLALMTPTQRVVCQAFSTIPVQLGGLGWSNGRPLSDFLDSALAEALIEKLWTPNDRLYPMENLSYALHKTMSSFVREPGYLGSLSDLLMPDASWRQLTISSFIDVDKSKLVVGPTKVVGPDIFKGYFRLDKDPSDPRPSIAPMVRWFYRKQVCSPEEDAAFKRFLNFKRGKPQMKSLDERKVASQPLKAVNVPSPIRQKPKGPRR